MKERNYNVIEGGKHVIKAWTKGVHLDANAEKQLRNVAELPFIFRWVAAMPDAHWGMGATIGSVIATKGAIIPAAVGVDLGCGMVAARTSYRANDLPDSLKGLRRAIEEAVPVGGPGQKGSWQERGRKGTPGSVYAAWSDISKGFDRITEKYPKIRSGYTVEQLGTLGTGNHFIEVCLDADDAVWVMLHSGSRGVGNRIASFFIERAKDDMKRWQVNLPDKDLAYFEEGSAFFDDYWTAVKWAQDFASINRRVMLGHVLQAVDETLGGTGAHCAMIHLALNTNNLLQRMDDLHEVGLRGHDSINVLVGCG